MKQGRMILSLVLAAMLSAVAPPATQALAATKKPAEATASAAKRKSYAFRQFTGTVSALDPSSLTVAKTGKAAKTMVFTKHAQMKTTGDLEKDARVTVYYREESGRPVAHKVVVKAAPLTAAS